MRESQAGGALRKHAAGRRASLDTGGNDVGRRRSPTAAQHVRVRREHTRPSSAAAEQVRWRRMHNAQATGGHEHESALAGEEGWWRWLLRSYELG
jgi:SH3-like domain-containing protein